MDVVGWLNTLMKPWEYPAHENNWGLTLMQVTITRWCICAKVAKTFSLNIIDQLRGRDSPRPADLLSW